LINYIMII